VISTSPKKTLGLIEKINHRNKIDVVHSRNLLSVIKNILRCDIFICGGGGLLQDETSIFNIPYHLWKPLIAKTFRKKVMFYAVGVGPIKSQFSKFITHLVLKRADFITTRDERSKNILVNISIFPNKILISTDPSFCLPFISAQRINNLYKTENIPLDEPTIGVCLRQWFHSYSFIPIGTKDKYGMRSKKDKIRYDDFTKEIARSLDYCVKEYGTNVIFIPFHKDRDDKVHKDIINQMKYQSNVYMIKGNYSPLEILGIISKLDFLVGMRLHSIIFAASSSVPFIGIEYMPKIREFAYEFFRENYEYYVIKLDEIKEETIRYKIDHIMNNHESISHKLKFASRKMAKRDSENINTLALALKLL
jgi:polysaccharide pyruvyl transferase WcaK-like protein